jgi:hypothetical protein
MVFFMLILGGNQMALTASQQSAQDYINKIGGVSAYTANQQAKLKDAQSSGNTDMLNRLTADETRTGLSYGQSQTAAPVPGYSPGNGGMWGAALGAANLGNNTTAMPGAAAGAVAGIPSTGIPSGSTPSPTPTATPTTTPQPTAQPVSAGQSYQAPDYAALAAARTATALAQKRTIAEQQKGSLDRSFQRSNQITNDNRTLQDFNTSNSVNRLTDGKQTWDKGIIGRERTLADESSQNNLLAQKSNIDSLLADYENATADEQVRIADELQRADRSYQLDLAKFNQDQSNSDRNFNQSQQVIDYNQNPSNPNNIGQGLQNVGQAQQNLLNQYKIDDYPAEQKANATKIQQELATGKMNLETAEYNLKQLKDPNSPKNQADRLDLQMKQLEAKNLPEKTRLELQQLKKTIEQIGVVHYKPQTQTEIDMDSTNLKIAQAKLKELQNGGGNPPTATEANNQYTADVVTNVDKMTPDNKISFFTNEKSALITKLGKSGYDNLYNYYFNSDGTPK